MSDGLKQNVHNKNSQNRSISFFICSFNSLIWFERHLWVLVCETKHAPDIHISKPGIYVEFICKLSLKDKKKCNNLNKQHLYLYMYMHACAYKKMYGKISIKTSISP